MIANDLLGTLEHFDGDLPVVAELPTEQGPEFFGVAHLYLDEDMRVVVMLSPEMPS